MSGKALTDGEYKEFLASLLEGVPSRELMDPDVVRVHLCAKAKSHIALALMLAREPESAIELLSTPLTKRQGFMAQLVFQANRLMVLGAAHEVKVEKGKYCDELINSIKRFVWRPELADIGLSEVALVDYRLSGKFLAEAGNVNCTIDPDKCRNYPGIVSADGVMVIQAQWGDKYRHKKTRWCRNNFHQLEQGGVVKEGLTAFLYGREILLRNCFMDLPGSVFSVDGNLVTLYWGSGPTLIDHFDDSPSGRYGAVSRGKI